MYMMIIFLLTMDMDLLIDYFEVTNQTGQEMSSLNAEKSRKVPLGKRVQQNKPSCSGGHGIGMKIGVCDEVTVSLNSHNSTVNALFFAVLGRRADPRFVQQDIEALQVIRDGEHIRQSHTHRTEDKAVVLGFSHININANYSNVSSGKIVALYPQTNLLL